MRRPIEYPHLSRTSHLRNRGRELLGKDLVATEKRDGSNMMVWISPKPWYYVFSKEGLIDFILRIRTGDLQISSRNMLEASTDLRQRLIQSRQWVSIAMMVSAAENHNMAFFVELVPEGFGPTRIEGRNAESQAVLFDIFDMTTKRFLPYALVHQIAFHFNMPVVKLVGEGRFTTAESYNKWVEDMFAWCRENRREGVVIKDFSSEKQVFVKEKIDSAPLAPITKIEDGKPMQPVLPDSEVMGAIDKVFADFGLNFMKDKARAMPMIVVYVKREAEQHDMRMPSGKLYDFYVEYMRSK